MNSITPFKDRKIDRASKVSVYRNLHAKTDAEKYSIKQKGLVVAHTNCLMMQNCEFVVGEKGREQVLRKKRKTVHAYIRGKIIDNIIYFGDIKVASHQFCVLAHHIKYNPYKHKTFVCDNYVLFDALPVKWAQYVILNNYGVFADNIIQPKHD